MNTSSTELNGQIKAARGGDPSALESLLGRYRNYLRVLAFAQMRETPTLKTRLDGSDLVQETLIKASQRFCDFDGQNEHELLGWLRQILVRNLVDQVRTHHAQKRDVRRQRSLEASMDRSSQQVQLALERGLENNQANNVASSHAIQLSDALAELPEDYRVVLMKRHIQRNTFREIAIEMKRSEGAVRMLWARALARLRELIDDSTA